MGPLTDKLRILLGVTGCIAAYKSCELLRDFQKAGADVQVVMSDSALEFVGERTFSALSGYPVGVKMFEGAHDPIPHIRLAEACDAMVIAPCTANTLAKLACGIADNLLTSTALACTAPVFIVPAMNVHMFENEATQRNIQILRERGLCVIDPASGYLACGDVGPGKMPEPSAIASYVMETLQCPLELEGKRVLITSGPTVEPIDAVRFISNRSSGKMGEALAKAALRSGAHVDIVSGPVSIAYPSEANVFEVNTAEEMLQACISLSDDADLIVCAAAVSDLKPETFYDYKLKKGADDGLLENIALVKNPDILKTLSDKRHPGQVVVGFAAETDSAIDNGIKKLESKGADLIVANVVGENAGFGKDVVSAALISADGIEELPEISKRELAAKILGRAAELLNEKA